MDSWNVKIDFFGMKTSTDLSDSDLSPSPLQAFSSAFSPWRRPAALYSPSPLSYFSLFPLPPPPSSPTSSSSTTTTSSRASAPAPPFPPRRRPRRSPPPAADPRTRRCPGQASPTQCSSRSSTTLATARASSQLEPSRPASRPSPTARRWVLPS